MPLDWIAPTIVGTGSLLTSVVAAYIALKANKVAKEAKTTGAATHVMVNSRMEEMLKLAKDEAAATATAIAQEAERQRTEVAAAKIKADDAARVNAAVAVQSETDRLLKQVQAELADLRAKPQYRRRAPPK